MRGIGASGRGQLCTGGCCSLMSYKPRVLVSRESWPRPTAAVASRWTPVVGCGGPALPLSLVGGSSGKCVSQSHTFGVP